MTNPIPVRKLKNNILLFNKHSLVVAQGSKYRALIKNQIYCPVVIGQWYYLVSYYTMTNHL